MKRHPHAAEAGLTLIEMMVALTISLVLAAATARVYLGAMAVKSTQDDATGLSETARFASDLIGRELRKAGFRNTWQIGSGAVAEFCPTGSNPLAPIQGSNDRVSINPASADFSGGTQTAIANASDVLRVRYYGEASGATATLTDCHGYPVAANTLVEDTLYVAADSANNNEPTLWCYTSNPAPATTSHPGALPLVAGVESLQLLFGEDSDSDGIVNRYVPWQLVAQAHKVAAVKVSLVARSPNPVALGTGTTTFAHFGGTSAAPAYPATMALANNDAGAQFTAPADKRLRKLFNTEIAVRNFGYCGQ